MSVESYIKEKTQSDIIMKDEMMEITHCATENTVYSLLEIDESPVVIDENHLEKLLSLWKNGILTRHQFTRAMHQYNLLLFQYASYLNENTVKKITITAKGVEITTDKNAVFCCNPEDVYGTPLDAFNRGRGEGLEAAESKILFSLMPDAGVFFDIGANIGWYSVQIAVNHPRSRVWAFEPLPLTYAWLLKNIAVNNLKNITPVNLGLGDRKHTVPFYFRSDMTGASSAENITECSSAQEISCQIDTLDNYWRNIKLNPDLIKCDTEGTELFVFRGSGECLATAKPMVFCEMLRKWSAKFNYTPNDTIAYFKTLGYNCYEIDGEKLRPFSLMTDDTIATNFFFLHREKHANIIREMII